jgi:hypothetical protein
MVGHLGGAAGGSGSAHHQSFRKHRWWAPWEVLSENSRVPTTNARKHRRRAFWEVLPEDLGAPTINHLENVDGRPLGGADKESESAHHQC